MTLEELLEKKMEPPIAADNGPSFCELYIIGNQVEWLLTNPLLECQLRQVCEPARAGDVEEVVMKLQGFLLKSTLLPLCQFHIPHNQNRLIDMKQSVMLTGLGSQHFNSVVCGHREGEKKQDLGQLVDPFNVFCPLLYTEVHTAENHSTSIPMTSLPQVLKPFFSITFEQYKPEFFDLINMVEVVSFQAVRVGHHDYVFVPKMRALCLLSCEAEAACGSSAGRWGDYNITAIKAIAKAPVSLLKKIKCKVGYGDSTEEESDKGDKPPQGTMKRLCLADRSTSSHDQLMTLLQSSLRYFFW
ncbi:hypothetical protein C8Q76DRAFT_692067 [Earliella scabrosa]|nr:hypothetical protein C8Q76DRAFT_692067 [Earliella scabrosa]